MLVYYNAQKQRTTAIEQTQEDVAPHHTIDRRRLRTGR
jgi:hypothetical protein